MARPLTVVATNVVAATVVLGVAAGCAHQPRDFFVATNSPPLEVYDCVMLELGRAGFTIVDADRSSGFVRARRIVPSWFDPKVAEIYATSMTGDESAEGHLQISGNPPGREDAAYIAEACAA